MRGNGPLEGEVKVQGSKNAALPMMAAAVLHEGRTVLHNCPRIADVFEMEAILRSMGVKTAWSGHTLELDCNKICETGIPGEETRTMRSSILLLGSMLGRCKRIRIGYPGGCTIGARPDQGNRGGDLRRMSGGSFRCTYSFSDFQCGCYGKCFACRCYGTGGNVS